MNSEYLSAPNGSGKTTITKIMNKNKTILPIIMLLIAALSLGACSDAANDNNKIKLNTIQLYHLSEDEDEIATLMTSAQASSNIVQFSVDETYKHVWVGYDYYENGKLIEKDHGGEVEANFEYEDGPQVTSGKICTMFNKDNIDINLISKNEKIGEENSINSGDSLAERGITFSDMDSFSSSQPSEAISIENGKNIPIWAAIADSDDGMRVADLETIMADKKMLGSYDKCLVFYARFE